MQSLLQLNFGGTLTPIQPKRIKLPKHTSNNCTANVLLSVLCLLHMPHRAFTHSSVQKSSGNDMLWMVQEKEWLHVLSLCLHSGEPAPFLLH